MPLLAGLLRATEDNVADLFGIDRVSCQQRPQARDRQVVAARVAIVSALRMCTADRRAETIDDNGIHL